MIAALDLTLVLTAAITALAGAAGALIGSFVTTKGQAEIAREEREAERARAVVAQRQADVMEAQGILAALVASAMRDAGPHKLPGPQGAIDRITLRQQLLAVFGRIGDPILADMVEGLFFASDHATGDETYMDFVESEAAVEVDTMEINLGEIVRAMHGRLGVLLTEA